MGGILLRLLPIICVLLRLPQEVRSVTKNTEPAHLGCHFVCDAMFNDAKHRWDDPDMMIEKCIDHCANEEMTLALLHNGNVCMCSETMTTCGEAPPGNCKTQCVGNQGERCGGPKAASIYTICDAIHYYKNCEYLCYCKDQTPCNFMTGICLNGVCDFQYEGTRCDEKRDSAFVMKIKSVIKSLQEIWQRIKGFFIVEEKIPSECDPGVYGISCDTKCHCSSGACDRLTGICASGSCSYGWIGRRCDKPNSCSNSPCLNGGKCILNGLKVTCECVGTYNGINCEFADPCNQNPCLHNGICTSKKTEFSCECTDDYYGERCENDAKGIQQGHVYISCFREMGSHREFLKEITNLDHNRMKPIACTRRCRASLYTYAGLQVGSQCWCSNTLGMYGAIPDSECARPCTGDKKQSCGDKHANSVYAVCPIGSYGGDCKAVCNCLHYACDLKSGECPNERCKVGFSGKRCEVVISEPVGVYAQRKSFTAFAIAGYAGFVIIITCLFVLHHLKMTGQLPAAALTPEGQQSTKVEPKTDKEEPKTDKEEPNKDEVAKKREKDEDNNDD